MKISEKINEMGESVKSKTNQFVFDSKAGDFLKAMKNRMGIGSPERNATDTYERELAIVPDCISANENEIAVKQYNIAVMRNLLKFERAEGRMQVTNKRIIFRAAGRSVGGRTTLQHEFAVNEIAGIEARNNYKFSFMYFIFALLIIGLAFFIICFWPFTGILSPIDSQSVRISGILYPKHVEKAYSEERAAISRTRQAGTNITEAAERIKQAYEKEEAAGLNVRNGIEKTRRVLYDYDWYDRPLYRNETYRDRTPAGLMEAQNALDSAIDAREYAEAEEQRFIAELEIAKENEANTIRNREDIVARWRALMTIFGFVLGIICLIPFFIFYKKFGLKLFFLNFSIFGFSLALAASGSRFFLILFYISCITAIICIFLYCFRPNLIISIKNKGGEKAAVDIRRDTLFTKNREIGTGFMEVFPTEETEGAIREIGAMIGDIQKLGDLGLGKWAKK
ncbi:MAG: hypothetical protein FWC19_02605 [Treponema sp.]|nr:hypothetical protein [Treponema sp.]